MEEIKENKEVLVPVAWLETLLRYVDKTKKALDEIDASQEPYKFRITIAPLLGYASSAETMLKYKEPKNQKHD